MQTNSFRSLSEQVVNALGGIATIIGQRPSDLLNWDEPDEWVARLVFDLDILGTIQAKQEAEIKKASRGKR